MPSYILLSLIIPFKNETGNLGELHRELISTLQQLKEKSEITYVDDGSTDSSLEVISESITSHKHKNISIKLISLRRNFGQTAAISAGLDQSGGQYIAMMDADLQNDPTDLLRMLKAIDNKTDVIFGWRKSREDSPGRVTSSKIANLIIGKMFKVPLHDMGCTIKLAKREVFSGMKLYGETHRILPVLLLLKGVNYKEVIVNHRRRLKEKSKYGYSRSLKLIIDLITIKFLDSYSTKPAYVFGTGGLLCILAGSVTLFLVAYRKIFLGVFVHRDPLFLITIFLLLIGTQFILMGLLAELLVRVYFESRQKPVYEIKSINTF